MAKAIGGLVTGSPALLSEAAHSVADSVNELFLLAGVNQSSRQPDAKHPFGYGKARYFYSMLAAVGIFVTGGCFSLYQGLRALRSETATAHFYVAFAVLGVSLLADSCSLLRATWQLHGLARSQRRRFAQVLRDPGDTTLATILAEDSTAVIGVLLATLGLWPHALTGSAMPEGIASIAIAVLLAFTAWRLGRSAEALLIGQAADPALIRQAYLALDSEPEVDTILAFLTMRMGIDTVMLAARIDLSMAWTPMRWKPCVAASRTLCPRGFPRWNRSSWTSPTPPRRTGRPRPDFGDACKPATTTTLAHRRTWRRPGNDEPPICPSKKSVGSG